MTLLARILLAGLLSTLAQSVAAAPVCGDGVIDVDEGCDDGDTTDGDGCSASCRPEPGERIYITNGFSSSVSILHGPTNRVIGTIPLGGASPRGLGILPDGSRVYVVNVNRGDGSTRGGNVSVIDTSSNRVVAVIDGLEMDAYTVTFGPGGSPAYVGEIVAGPSHVAVIDPVANTLVTRFAFARGQGSQVIVHPSGNPLYVVLRVPGLLLAVDTTTGDVSASVAIRNLGTGVALGPDGTSLYIAHETPCEDEPCAPGNLTVVDTATLTPTAVETVGHLGFGVAYVLTPAGPRLYMAQAQEDVVEVFDAAGALPVSLGTVPVGRGPLGVQGNASGTRVYVSNRTSLTEGTVSVIDTATNTVIATVPVGAYAYSLGGAITPPCLDACDDGVACTTDGCTSEGCRHEPTAAACDDGNQCTDDACDASVGCVHTARAGACDDGIFCNGADTCSAGVCSAHAGNPCPGPGNAGECQCDEGARTCIVCNDGNECTDDACEAPVGCVYTARAGACDDGIFCNGADTCSEGVCSGHAGDPCPGPDGDENCHESCDEEKGCVAPDPEGSACIDEGDPCTVDRCTAFGDCAHVRREGCTSVSTTTTSTITTTTLPRCAGGCYVLSGKPLVRAAEPPVGAEVRVAADAVEVPGCTVRRSSVEVGATRTGFAAHFPRCVGLPHGLSLLGRLAAAGEGASCGELRGKAIVRAGGGRVRRRAVVATRRDFVLPSVAVTPGSVLSLGASCLAPDAAVAVRFVNDEGFEKTVAAMSGNPVTVLVPTYVDPTSGASGAGVVRVAVELPGGVSVPVLGTLAIAQP